jgi:hypothetical protein
MNIPNEIRSRKTVRKIPATGLSEVLRRDGRSRGGGESTSFRAYYAAAPLPHSRWDD